MEEKNDILNIFYRFNEENIDYFILRDFKSLDDILNSKDIDIYINSDDTYKVDKIFKSNKWTLPKLDNNKYPHKQYFKLSSNKVCIFDIVDGFYYGKDNLKLDVTDIMPSLENVRTLDKIKVASEKIALTTMLLHVIFDKQHISDKNYDILTSMYQDYLKSGEEDNGLIYEIARNVISSDLEVSNNNIHVYQKQIKDSHMLVHESKKNIILKIKGFFKNIIKRAERRLKRKTVAVIGMDGTGKSSIVESLKNIYGDKCEVIYMGLKEFKIRKLEKLALSKNNNLFGKIEKRFLLLFEMLGRYLKYRYSGKVLIFDRYVDDIFVCSSKSIDSFLFRILFPKPKLKIYMYCDSNVSFERKDDIGDKELFISIKEKFDSAYLEDSKVFCVSTDVSSKEETLSKVLDIMNENFKDGIF